MQNILILSSERCGTTYLLNLISCSLHKCKNLNEFFNLHKDSISNHLQYIIKYLRQNRPECVLLYKDFLDNLTELSPSLSIEKRLINHQHLITKLRDLKRDKYNYSLTKLFLSQYNDLDSIISVMDQLIVLYRNNILEQFISVEKALYSGLWYINNNTCDEDPEILNKNKQLKIIWDKKKFLCFAQKRTEDLEIYLSIYKKYSKPKIWLSYEEMINRPIEKTYEILSEHLSIPLDVKIYNETDFAVPNRPVKQSSNIAIENNFTNSELFLSDLPSIQDKIFVKPKE